MTEGPMLDGQQGLDADEWDGRAPQTDGGAEQDVETILDRIESELESEEIHGISVTVRNGSTYYAVVAHSTRNNGGPVVELRTVVVDLADEVVKVTGNGIWIPRNDGAVDTLPNLAARTHTDVCGSGAPSGEPTILSGIDDVDAEGLMGRAIAPDDYDSDEEDDSGPPAELELMVERLEEAGIDGEQRFNRLDFGGKAPWDHQRRPAEEMVGNYGVYATKEDDLAIIDVDDPDAAPLEELPETFGVSSPHGDDRRAHWFVAVDDLEEITDLLGTWNQKPSWGDVRVANQYVVGPGSQLDAEGCDAGDYEAGEPEGCPECSSATGGTYDVIDDSPIKRMDVDELVELLAEDEDVEVIGERADDQEALGAAAEAFDEDELARIREHAEEGDMAALLRVIGATHRMDQAEAFVAEGVIAPEDMIEHYSERGDFEDVDGIGPATSEDLEAALPLIREATASTVQCAKCGAEIEESEASVIARDGDQAAYACREGCQ